MTVSTSAPGPCESDNDGHRLAVLGGGVIGVATAWYLARDGFQVTRIERRKASVFETAFADAGLIAPGMSDPWTAPGTPWLILRSLGREYSPLLLPPTALPGTLSWGPQFLRQCSYTAWQCNPRTIRRLRLFSHECLRSLASETGVDHESDSRGAPRLIRDRISLLKSTATGPGGGRRLRSSGGAAEDDGGPQQGGTRRRMRSCQVWRLFAGERGVDDATVAGYISPKPRNPSGGNTSKARLPTRSFNASVAPPPRLP